jgi:hypothetical protein
MEALPRDTICMGIRASFRPQVARKIEQLLFNGHAKAGKPLLAAHLRRWLRICAQPAVWADDE